MQPGMDLSRDTTDVPIFQKEVSCVLTFLAPGTTPAHAQMESSGWLRNIAHFEIYYTDDLITTLVTKITLMLDTHAWRYRPDTVPGTLVSECVNLKPSRRLSTTGRETSKFNAINWNRVIVGFWNQKTSIVRTPIYFIGISSDRGYKGRFR